MQAGEVEVDATYAPMVPRRPWHGASGSELVLGIAVEAGPRRVARLLAAPPGGRHHVRGGERSPNWLMGATSHPTGLTCDLGGVSPNRRGRGLGSCCPRCPGPGAGGSPASARGERQRGLVSLSLRGPGEVRPPTVFRAHRGLGRGGGQPQKQAPPPHAATSPPGARNGPRPR